MLILFKFQFRLAQLLGRERTAAQCTGSFIFSSVLMVGTIPGSDTFGTKL